MSTILFDNIAVEGREVVALVASNGYLGQKTGACSMTALIQGQHFCFFQAREAFLKLSFENKELVCEYLNWEDCLALSELFMAHRGKTLTVVMSIVPKYSEDGCVLKYTKADSKRVGKEIWHIMGVRVLEGNHFTPCAAKSLPNVETASVVPATKPSGMDD